MYIGVISMRYAKALLAYADEKGTEDTVYEEAGILADSFSRIPELRQALDNPVLPAETKLKLICEAAGGGKVSEELKRFVELVLEERREKFLQFMIMSYIDLYRKQKNISVGKITTVCPVAEVISGAGGSLFEDAIARGADCLLTGEANHHHAIDAKRLGLSLIAAGHYATEFPVTAAVAEKLRTAFPELEILVSEDARDPYTYL